MTSAEERFSARGGAGESRRACGFNGHAGGYRANERDTQLWPKGDPLRSALPQAVLRPRASPLDAPCAGAAIA